MPETFVDPESLKEFKRNLRRVNDWTDPAIIQGLEMAANEVANHAKAEHPRPASRAERIAHPYPRFYTWRGITAAAIYVGRPRAEKNKGAEIDVISPEPHSAGLEFGTPTARAFPFMGPALEQTQDKAFLILAVAIRKSLKG